MQPEQIDLTKLPPELQALYTQTDANATAAIEQPIVDPAVEPEVTATENAEPASVQTASEEEVKTETNTLSTILEENKEAFLNATTEDKILFIKSIL